MSARKKTKVAQLFLRTSSPTSAPERPAPKRKVVARRPRAPRRSWTAGEDELVRRLTDPRPNGKRTRRPVDWNRVLEALPGRTKSSICARRGRLRLSVAGRKWTRAEDALLKSIWQESARRTITDHLPGRSWLSILTRAYTLKLRTMPQGWEPLEVAFRGAEVYPATGRRIVEWANRWAPLVESLCAWGYECGRAAGEPGEWSSVRYDGGAVVARAHTTVWIRKGGGPRSGRRWTLVEEGSVADAVERWQSWEGSAQAARRLGVSVDVAVDAAVREGYVRRSHAHASVPHHYLPPAWWDDAVARRPPCGLTKATMRRRAMQGGAP
jgi:hypothetical protein